MALYEVFSHPVYVRYKAGICSKAVIYYVLSICLTIAVPFLIAYLSEGFWRKYETYREQPHVRFKHNLVLIAETNRADKLLFWSSYSVLNDIMNQNLRYPTITNREVDNNGDGKNDILNLKIDIPVTDEENVHSVKLLLFFDYRLYVHSAFIMEGLAYIHHSSPLPGESLSIVGDLSLHQKIPLKHKGKDGRYNFPVIDLSTIDVNDFKLENILLSYASRDVTTYLKYSYPVWKTGRGAKQPFSINVTILYPEETIIYKAGFWQLIKWAWTQLCAIMVIMLYLFYGINTFVFRNQVVPTLVENPLMMKRI